MNLAEKIKDIDMVSLVVAEGIQVRRAGQSWVGKCPFHEDKTPSFTIRGGRFRCFGCGAHGDSIDFIRALKDFSFKDACNCLGIETSKPTTPTERKQIQAKAQERKRRRALVETFRVWEAVYSTELGRRIRRAYSWIKKYVTGPEDLDGSTGTMLVGIYRHLPQWEERLQTLTTGTDEEKFELFREVNHGT